MRKGKLYISFLLGLCLCLFTALFTSCKDETPPPTLESISVSGETEVFIDEFDYADYTITATYSDNSTKTATLTADNLSADDNAKLSTVGTHSLTVSYESVTCSWTVTLKNHEFSGVTFDDVTTTYDGTAKTLAVSGLPTGAQVSYDKETSYTNAGEYTVKATVTLANYNPVELTATLTINKATYDMSAVAFADKTVTYNGESHSIEATNLPNGVTAEYTGNNQINAGEYEITATFTGDSQNYESIADKTATLTIEKATIMGITFTGAEYTYDGKVKSLAIAGTLPDGVTVSYTGNNQTNAGEHPVTATFSKNANYNDLSDMQATLKIKKATYDMSAVVFKDKSVNYTGEAYSIEATNLPKGVSVRYDGNNKTQAGEYTVTAIFTGDSRNYNEIPNMTATLKINASDLTGISFHDGEFTYDGQPKSLAITGTLPDGVKVSYENNGQVNADSYTVKATFTCTNGNYTNLPELTATLTIKKATYDMSGVLFKDKSVNYNGQAHSIEATNLPEGVSVRYDGNNKTQAGEYTITAIFTGDSQNYEAIPNMTATLKINASDLTGVSFHDGEFTYDGTKKSIYITGELPDGVKVDYTNNEQINADSYTVTATFTCTNGNYTNLPELTATLTIKKAVYDMSAVIFTDKTVTYDGQAHSIEATNLPQGVTAEYTGNKQINAGEYEITATFTGDSQNYELIASQTVTLTIEQRELTLVFNGETTLKYNGKAQKTITVQATNLVNGDSVELTVSYNGEMIEAGEYIATATLTAHKNYKLTANNTVKVTITRATHTVTFKQDGVADIVKEVLDLADLTDIPQPKAVDGYKFTWNRKDFTSITEDITVTANKTIITYTIEYVLQYGKNPTENPKTYTIESASITLKNPENLFGMQFGGWYTSETFLPSTSVTSVGGGQFGDITLYGQFIGYRVEEAIGFEIDYSQGTPTISKTVPYATVEMDLRDSITISNGCTWQVAGDELGTVIYSRKIVPFATGENVFYLSVFHPDGNHDTLYELHVYRLDMKTYQFVNGVTGEVLETGEIEETSSVDTAIIQPDNAGYTFVSWTVNGETVTFPYVVTTDVMFTAEYRANENTLKFNGNGATNGEMSDIIIRTDETRTLPSNSFERLGYVFLGWSTEANGEVVYADNANYKMGVKSEYTLYAVWGAMFTVENGTIFGLTEHGKAFSALVIPDIIDGVTITKIAESALANNTQLYSLEIPDSVTFIGKSALSGCTKLNSLTFPFVGESPTATSYASVFGYIFGYTTSTSSSLNGYTYQYNDGSQYYYYNVPASLKTVTVTKVNLPEKAFERQRTLETVTLGNAITSVSKEAFEECISLKTVNLGKNVQTIEQYAFYKCSSLTSIEIPDSVTSIDSYAFYYCSDLANVTLGKNITSIGGYAFEDCGALKTITIGDKTQVVGYRAFCNCNSLTIYCEAASTPSTWNEDWNYSNRPVVWNYAGIRGETDDGFVWAQTKANTIYITSYTGSATDLTIPNEINGCTVKIIGKNAFYNNENLTKIYIHDSILEIGSYAFNGCSNATIYCEAENQPSGWNTYWNYSSRPVVWNCAGEGNTDGFSWIQYKDNTVSVVGYTGSATELAIPNEINGQPVASIGSSAFRNCNSLTSVVIPDSVTSIGSSAFDGCSSLTEITLPFVGATKDGTSNTHFGYIFGASSYYYNDDYVPTSLKKVTVTLATSISNYAFSSCDSLTNVVIGDSVTSIGGWAFSSCDSLTNVVIGDSVTSIGNYAFSSCDSLTSVEIGDSVTSIGNYAFYNCSSLTSIEIPDSVTYIGSSAFSGCSSLTEITLPFVGAKAGVTASDTYQYPVGYIFGTSSYTGGSATTQYYYGSSTSSTTNNTYYIPTSLKKVTVTGGNILYGAFNHCDGLTSVVIGDSVTSISNSAFYNCSSLTSVVIGNGVTSIGNSAFAYCSSLTSVTIPDSVTSIGDYAFYYCDSLTSVVIGDGVTSIGDSAFYNCSSLTSIEIPDSVTYIGSSVFSGCSSLTSVEIGDSVTSIGNYAFYNCSSLTSVVIGDNVTSIGSEAFRDCSSLTSIVIPDSVTSIGDYAFYWCSKLTGVYITDIESWCNISFGNYSANPLCYANNLYLNNELVTELVIPNTVTKIESYAFAYCDSLTSVEIGDSVTSIGNFAFEDCSSLTIYCEVASKPSGWESSWNYSKCPVVWGWSGLQYTYTFESNGGSTIQNITSKFAIALPTPTKDGWYFGGWYDNADLTGSPVSSPYYSATKTTLYAKWLTEEEYYDGSSFGRAIQAEVGGSYTVTIDTAGEKVYYKFTATESKSYTIKSSGGLDTYGYLYNSSQSQLTYNDGSTDFTITRSLTAGETYYVVVKMYSSSATGTFTLTIS